MDSRIADYAAIGNCRTLALVSRVGALDWWCLPDFSGPSFFGALLDNEQGGRFVVAPQPAVPGTPRYEADTNVLVTRFETTAGVLEVTDFMVMPEEHGTPPDPTSPHEVVRLARCISGTVDLQLLYEPAPDYARRAPRIVPVDTDRWRCEAPGASVTLSSTLALQPDAEGRRLTGRATLKAGESQTFIVWAVFPSTRAPDAPLDVPGDHLLATTLAWWRDWCGRSRYEGEFREEVTRSALALKLLTDRPSGAVVAAGTTSLPESETGERNWDYRYCWLRDTSLVLNAFMDLGHHHESDAFLRWLLHATKQTRPRLQVLYDIRGNADIGESTLPHLRGYRGIAPVRIGNQASAQQQNDVYGEVILTAWSHAERGGHLDEQEKSLIVGFAEFVCDLWRQPDQGLWEIRLPARHNTHSKLMCWAALDRTLELHKRSPLPIDVARFTAERDAIRADIDTHGFDPALNSYVGYYGGQAVDASLLLMPRLNYLPADDPRMLGTVQRIFDTLAIDGLLFRYPPGPAYDGVGGGEHLFVICSFWCVDCLARQGRLYEAKAMYRRLLALRNPVGLYAEEIAVHTGEAMGNFPQAFSHVGSITAAMTIAREEQARAQRTGAG